MSDLKDRFRTLDRIPAPDVWPDARRREPAEVRVGPSWTRVAVAALAFTVAAAGIGVAGWAFIAHRDSRLVDRPPPMVPRANGLIAFAGGERPGSPFRPSSIYAINPDGSGLRRVTKGRWVDWEPAWSPDGQRLAFVRRGGEFPPNDIYVVNADGTGLRRLTDVDQFQNSPTWSPDGGRIAFSRGGNNGDYDLYEMDADGSRVAQLTNAPGNEVSPSWSPDGRYIAYVASTMPNSGAEDLFVMAADGTGQRQLTRTGMESSPAWSPDGRTIAVLEGRGHQRIVTLKPDGSRSATVFVCAAVPDCYGLLDPTWSPDGSKIAFTFERQISREDIRSEIDLIDADGSGLQRLDTGRVPACCPAWQPVPEAAPPPFSPTPIPGGTLPSTPKASVGDIAYVSSSGRRGPDLGDACRRGGNVGLEYDPAWSPGGTQIVCGVGCAEEKSEAEAELAVIDADGTG